MHAKHSTEEPSTCAPLRGDRVAELAYGIRLDRLAADSTGLGSPPSGSERDVGELTASGI